MFFSEALFWWWIRWRPKLYARLFFNSYYSDLHVHKQTRGHHSFAKAANKIFRHFEQVKKKKIIEIKNHQLYKLIYKSVI